MKCDCKDKYCNRCREVLWTTYMEGTYLPRWMIEVYNYLTAGRYKKIYIQSMSPAWIDKLPPSNKKRLFDQSYARYKHMGKGLLSLMSDPRCKVPREVRERIKRLAKSGEPTRIGGLNAHHIIFDEITHFTPEMVEQVASIIGREIPAPVAVLAKKEG